jgi:drug/metabolite transporter (DMT)-like permease
LYLPRQPLWLLGVAAAVGSFVFQALALHNGPLSVVQPLLITKLVFTLVLRRVWIHQDVARAAWASVSIVCVSLAVFLAVGEPTDGPAKVAIAVVAFGVMAAGVAMLTRTALQDLTPSQRADSRWTAPAPGRSAARRRSTG